LKNEEAQFKFQRNVAGCLNAKRNTLVCTAHIGKLDCGSPKNRYPRLRCPDTEVSDPQGTYQMA